MDALRRVLLSDPVVPSINGAKYLIGMLDNHCIAVVALPENLICPYMTLPSVLVKALCKVGLWCGIGAWQLSL